jgi:hypothetical protein
MDKLDLRIKNALVSVDPNSKNPAWHGAPTAIGVLRGVNTVVAVWRPYEECNNIRELALHIAFWENSVTNRLLDERVRLDFEQWKTSMPTRLDVIEEKQWKAELKIVKSAHKRFADAVREFDPRLLDQPLGKRSTRPAIEYIHGAAEHRLYHTAQMELIKQLAKQAGVG